MRLRKKREHLIFAASNKQTKKTKEAADMKKNIPTVLAVIAALAITVISLGATDGDAAR